MINYLADNKEIFKDEIVNASVGTIFEAFGILTKVECRMWIENCKTYEDFHPSHFEGLEEEFIKTGKWKLPKVDLSGK